MKLPSPMLLLCAVGMLIFSCRKHTGEPISKAIERKVQFNLFTEQDFSDINDTIRFSVFIENAIFHILWDSTLAPMQIKNIPGPDNKLVIEKIVPGNDTSTLKVGFKYGIDHVGFAGYFDEFKAGDTFKVVSFNFQ